MSPADQLGQGAHRNWNPGAEIIQYWEGDCPETQNLAGMELDQDVCFICLTLQQGIPIA
jgi:hypothetical protein